MKAGEENSDSEEVEKVLPNGNIVAFACGPLLKERYINPKIEQELVEFKQEIEDKFHESDVNRQFRFPRIDSQYLIKNQISTDNVNTEEIGS